MLTNKTIDLNNFNKDGYVIKDIFCRSEEFSNLAKDLQVNIQNYLKNNSKQIRKLGGYKSGNLNFVSKNHSDKLLELLDKNAFKDYFNFLTKEELSDYEIILGGNLNFPKSKNQFFHTDGNWDPRMIIVNIATTDISNHNGPMEIIIGSHKLKISYWRFIIKKIFLKKKKIRLNKGELIIREHRLWHRGTTNYSSQPREMIGIMFKKKLLNKKKDCFKQENFLIFSNIFGNSTKEKFKEFIFLNFRFMFSLYKIIISILR